MKITADTIMHWQIREMRDAMYDRVALGVDTVDDRELHALCESALNEMCHPARRSEALRRCAEAWNVRHGGEL